jgi:PAS domain S-box-containing protein
MLGALNPQNLPKSESQRVIWNLFLANFIICPIVVIIYFLMGAEKAATQLTIGYVVCTPLIYILIRLNKPLLVRYSYVVTCCTYVYLLSRGFDYPGTVHLLCFPLVVLCFVIFDGYPSVIKVSAILIPALTWILIYWWPYAQSELSAPSAAGRINYFILTDTLISLFVLYIFLTILSNSHDRRKMEELDFLKLAKKDLRQAHDELDQFFRLNMNVLVISEPDGRIRKMSPMLPQLLGFTEGEMQGKLFLELVHPDDLDKSVVAFKKVQEGTPLTNFDNRYLCKNGQVRTLNWNCSSCPTSKLLYAIGHDVTEFRENVREKLQLFNVITQSAIFTTTDAKGRILTVNDKFCQISGYNADELIGRDHRILNSNTHSKAFFKEMWQTISSGNIWYGELENRAKDGHHYFVSTVISPVMDANGKIDKYFAIRFDRTKEHDLDIQLQVEKAKSIHTAKLASLGEISSGIAHEINNPLTIITGSLRLLASPNITPERFQKQCEVMQIASDRIVRIIKSLQRFTLPSSSINLATKNINDVVTGALLLVSGCAKQYGIPIELSLFSTALIDCDEVEIQQVFTNLIFNAIDAAKLFVDRWVKIVTFDELDEVVIQVLDSGRGIPPEIQEKFFQPFFTTKKVGQGTGLGLCIVKGILDRHNGSIKVKLVDGHTCFELHFAKANVASIPPTNSNFSITG